MDWSPLGANSPPGRMSPGLVTVGPGELDSFVEHPWFPEPKRPKRVVKAFPGSIHSGTKGGHYRVYT